MNARPPTHQEVREKQIAFHASLFGSLLFCVVIHMIAPSLGGGEFMRISLVILFFGCLASAFWSLTDIYAEYLQTKYRWRYADAGPAIRSNVERFVRRQGWFMRQIGWIGTLAATLAGLAVLAEWPTFAPALGPLRQVFVYAAVAAAFAVPGYAIFASQSLREAIALRHQIDEETSIAGVKLRTPESEAEAESRSAGPPVQVLGPMRFQAGGYDWHWGDFYKNAAIFGQPGTGKTICVLNALLEGLIASSGQGKTAASGLILDPKGDFRDKIALLCRKHGRSKDLMVLDPNNLSESIRWNPLDSTDDALELAGRFGGVMETLSPSGGDEKFWIESSKRLVQNLIALMRHARPDEPPSLVDIHEAAMSDEALDRWGGRVPPELIEQSRGAKRVMDYFSDVWVPMPDNTKGAIRAFVANMLGSFLVEPYDELFSGRSTATIADMIDEGKILYVYMPIADKEVMARVVSTFVKLEFYREVLKRPDKERPSFFLCDEFQSFFTAGSGRGDADAFERTRQSNHANVVAFQNLNALFKQTDKKEPVWNLLGNCAIKLFLRNTEEETNEYASKLFGEHIETLSASSIGIGRGMRGQGQSRSLSGSAQYAARIKKDAFTELAVPSREDGVDHAEVIAHLAARSRVETQRMTWKVHPITSGAR